VGFLRSAVRKDVRRHLRDPWALLFYLFIPLLIGGAIILATGGSAGPSPSAQLLVVDEDGSIISNLLVNALGQAGGIIQAEKVTRTVGEERIQKGEGSALLEIPAGFGDAVLQEKSTKLLLITNPEQSILPGIIEETLEIVVDGTFYVHRILGEELQVIAAGPAGGATTLADADVAQISTSINQIIQRLEPFLFPPVIGLETSVDEQEPDNQVSIGALFLPGILMMSLLFIAQGLGEDVWREREQGTLRRMVSTPVGVTKFLAGKLIAGSVVILGIALIILIIGMAYLSMPFSNLPLALVWSVLSGGVFVNLLMLLQMYASSQRAASILASSLIFPLLMLGGSFFPSEVMPSWLAAIGRWTPNGWALEQLKSILLDRVQPGSLLIALMGLLIVGGVVFFLNARRMGRTFAKV